MEINGITRHVSIENMKPAQIAREDVDNFQLENE